MKAALLNSSLPPSRAHPKSSPLCHLRRSIPRLELARFPSWNGLKSLARPLSFGNFTPAKRRGNFVVARNLGKTLRAFQPTIRELQEMSNDFKSTLEREIGLDEVVSPRNYINKSALYADEKQETVVDPNGKHLDKSYTREDLLKVTEQQLVASDATSKIESENKHLKSKHKKLQLRRQLRQASSNLMQTHNHQRSPRNRDDADA